MKNKALLLGASLALFAGVMMIIFWISSMVDPGALDPELTKSLIDKVMWSMLILGCAEVYILVGVSFGRGLTPEKSSPKLFAIFMVIFIVGLYYSAFKSFTM